MGEPRGDLRGARPRFVAIVLPVAFLLGVIGIARAFASHSDERSGYRCVADYYKLSDMRELSKYSSTAVVIRIDGVDGSIDRGASGCSIFTPIHATVLKQVAGTLMPRTLTFMTSGDATVTAVNTSDPAALSGGYAEGEIHLVTLAPTDSWPGGPRFAARLEGNWHVVGDEAVSADGRFTGSLAGVEDIMGKGLYR
jgi:hypothetical protein